MQILVACSDQESASNSVPPAHEDTSIEVSDHGILLSAPNKKAANLYLEISNLVDTGDFIEANQHARKLCDESPDWSGAWIALANSAQSGEQFARASKKASELSEGGTLGERLWAEINMGFVTNDTQASLRTGKKLLESYPDSARAALVLSGIYAGQNQIEQAREAGEKAITLAADWLPARTNLGFSYLYNDPKDYHKAEGYFTQAIALAPQGDNLWVNIGDVHRAAGKLEEAQSSYSHALEIDAGNAIAAVKRAHVNSFLGHYDSARADYDRGIAVSKEGNQATLPVYRAFINLHAGNPDEAVVELNELLGKIDSLDMPEDQKLGARIFTLTNVSDICFHNDMKTCSGDAVASLKSSLATVGKNSGDPDFERGQAATALYWQGKLDARMAEYASAREKAEAFKRLLESDSNPRKLERYHELLGLTALLEKEYDKSIEHYRQSNLSLSAAAGDVKISYMLATALKGAGQHEEADERLAKVASWNFNSAWFAMLRKNAEFDEE